METPLVKLPIASEDNDQASIILKDDKTESI